MKTIEIAGCVILDDYGRILLIHRSDAKEPHWELPGGKLETDETAEEAAVRGLREELDIDVRLVGSLGSELSEQGDRVYQYNWFQAVIAEGLLNIMDTHSHDDADYFDLEDMPSIALSNNMLILYPKIYSGEISIDSSAV
jgi:ADP-ribose pyrophosphatase YjhB (NUDIX family)